MRTEDERRLQQLRGEHSHVTYEPPTPLPARVTDERDTVLVQRSEAGVLYVRAAHNADPATKSPEELLFSAAVTETQVHLLFANGTQLTVPRSGMGAEPVTDLALPSQEPKKAPEVPLVRFEAFFGNRSGLARSPQRSPSREYYFPAYYRPDPVNHFDESVVVNVYLPQSVVDTLDTAKLRLGALLLIEGEDHMHKNYKNKEEAVLEVHARTVGIIPDRRRPKPSETYNQRINAFLTEQNVKLPPPPTPRQRS